MPPRSASDDVKRLKATIAELYLTRQEAADLLHISIHTLNKWLLPAGKRKIRKAPAWAADVLPIRYVDRMRGASRKHR